jgi:hypothetical protein
MLSKLLLVLLVCAPFAIPQSSTVPAKETLHYNIEWRLINAGKARLDWQARPQVRSGWQANLHLESAGLVSKLFKVEDDYVSLLNPNLCVESTQITTHEGTRQRETKITYDHETRKASYLERDRLKNTTVLSREIDIPACVHDVVGGLYFMRTLNLEPNQSIEVPVSDGKKSVMAKVEAQQRDEVKTPAGVFKTIRYELYLFNNVLYQRSGHLTIWLTDDRRKLPVQIRVRLQFTIGTITLSLAKQE